MFGRKRKQAVEDVAPDDEIAKDANDEPQADESTADDGVKGEGEAAAETGEPSEGEQESADEGSPAAEEESAEDADEAVLDDSGEDDVDEDDNAIDAVPPEAEDVDWRADGPFDADEVDLDGDTVKRMDLGALVLTPFDGLQLQLQVNPETKRAEALAALWKQSGLEVVLFAARSGGGEAAELRDEVIDEAQEAGGTASLEDGPFGPQVYRVLSQEGPKGEQLVQVSRVWFVDGPRWTLRGTLLGQAALGEAGNPDSLPFVEFFRNIIVRRGEKPMVPGDVMSFDVPMGAAVGGPASADNTK